MSIAIYKNNEDFNVTNKWLGTMLRDSANEQDSKYQSIPGEIIVAYDKI